MRASFAIPALLLTHLWPAGCTVSRFQHDGCEANADCRAAFGWGSVCNADGLCEDLEVPVRCADSWPEDLWTDRDAHAGDIVLGVNYDQTNFGLEVLAMELAIQQVNAEGGLDGTPFALAICDSQNDPELTPEEANVANAEWLADSVGVPGMVGPATSGETEDAYRAASDYGALIISPSATSPALTTLDGLTSTDAEPGLLWRTAPPDDLQGEVIAGYMSAEGVKQVAVLHETGPYGEGLAAAFYEVFLAAGGVADLYPWDSTTARDEAIQAAATGPYEQVLYIAGEKDDLTAFLFAAAQYEAFNDPEEPLGIFLADGAYYIEIFDEVDDEDLFRNVRGTRPALIPGPVYDAFAASYRAAYEGQDPGEAGYTAYAYDASWLLLYGAAWSQYQEGAITGLGIGRGLRRISSGASVDIRPSSWNLVRASFQEAQGVDVVGASGELDYDPQTGETSAPIEIWSVAQGEDGYEFTTEDVVYPD